MVARLNNPDKKFGKDVTEAKVEIAYGTVSSFQDFQQALCEQLDVDWNPACKIYDPDGVEQFESDLPMFNDGDIFYVAPQGAEFDHAAFMDNYKLEGEVGEGGYGTVFRASHRKTGELVAVKFMDITENL